MHFCVLLFCTHTLPMTRMCVCVCVCVVSAKGPLSLPGHTVLSPLDRWPTPSLSSSPSLHLSLLISPITVFLSCSPQTPSLFPPPSIPLSHYTYHIINQSGMEPVHLARFVSLWLINSFSLLKSSIKRWLPLTCCWNGPEVITLINCGMVFHSTCSDIHIIKWRTAFPNIEAHLIHLCT